MSEIFYFKIVFNKYKKINLTSNFFIYLMCVNLFRIKYENKPTNHEKKFKYIKNSWFTYGLLYTNFYLYVNLILYTNFIYKFIIYRFIIYIFYIQIY